MWEKELKEAIKAGLLAKDVIMDIYKNHEFNIEIKSDDSPVTIADKKADKIIKEYLQSVFPEHAFLTEESNDDLTRLNNDYVWIVDPVDGTKDFIAKDDEFTTNIALAYKHEIVVGVVLAPALDDVYYASKGNGAFYLKNGVATRIHVNDKLDDITCLTSVFHLNEKEKQLIEKHSDKIKHVNKKGSALKACLIAKGDAELSYRMSDGTKEWDTAASNIVVEEAGGVFVEPDGNRLTYNRKDVYNRKGYVITNRKENILL